MCPIICPRKRPSLDKGGLAILSLDRERFADRLGDYANVQRVQNTLPLLPYMGGPTSVSMKSFELVACIGLLGMLQARATTDELDVCAHARGLCYAAINRQYKLTGSS